MQEIKVLCVDDEKNVLRSLERLFFDEDYSIITAESGKVGLEILEKEQCQIIISDYRMPEMTGVEFLREARKKRPDTVRIVLSGYADVASIVSAINEGEIYKFIPKPWNDDELKVTVSNAIEKYNLEQENKLLTEQVLIKNMELADLNKNLEKRVEEKTADLLIQNEVLKLSQSILDVLPVGIMGIDNEGTIVQINNFARKILKDDNKVFLSEKAESIFTDETVKLIETAGAEGKSIGSSEGYNFTGSVICVPLIGGKEQRGCIIVFNPEHNE